MRKKLKTSDFCGPDAPEEQIEVAKRLANHYKHFAKAESVYAKPFNSNLPVELQTVFTHFLKAAEVVIELEAEPRDYIAAQFDGLAWAKKVPFPAQLYTSNARVRFANYMLTKEDRESKVVTEEDYMVSNFAAEERKAKKMAERLGVSVRRALKMVPEEFSRAYLKHVGVWDSIAR